MKYGLVVLIVLTQFSTWSKNKDIILNGYSFRIQSSVVEISGDSVFMIKLFRVDTLNIEHYLLSHVTKDKIGDCNSEMLELGTYSCTDSTITYYSFWCSTGDAPASPYGARKQTYKVYNNGEMKLFSSQLYLEATTPGWCEYEGIKFLFEKPKTEVEKRQFEIYIKKIEIDYNARFVFGINAKNLIKEVKEKLNKEIETETENWNTSNGPFGTRL